MIVALLITLAFMTTGQAQSPASAAPGAERAASEPPPPDRLPAPDKPVAAPTVDPDAIGVSLDRIQKAVIKPQAFKLTESRRVFRVSVFGDNPRIEDILGPDYLKGPVPYSPMTHQEFLNMVTPKDVQGYAAFSNKQGMIVAATSVALQWALQKAIDKLKDAHSDRAREAAQKEVQQALAALRKARRDAGLPDK